LEAEQLKINNVTVGMSSRSVLVIHSAADLYGASRNLIRSLLAFQELDYDIIVILPMEGPLADQIRELGIKLYILDHGVLRRKHLNPIGVLKLSQQLAISFKKLNSLINDYRIDLIYTNSNANIIGGLLAKKKGIEHIWHIHEIIQKPVWFKNALEHYIDFTGQKVICVSEAVKNNLTKIKRDKLKVVYNGIDLQPFLKANYNLRQELDLPEGTVIIGMVARVHFWKGQNYFLEVAARLCEKYDNLHFIMVGDAFSGYEYLYDEINDLISKYNLKSKVTDLGFRTDIASILSGIDIFMLPSILPDPLPTTVLEAMASGLPVVATAHGGACEMVVDNLTGYLVPWDDPVKASKSFYELIENELHRKEMGMKGRERVEQNFSIHSYIKNFGEVFSEKYN